MSPYQKYRTDLEQIQKMTKTPRDHQVADQVESKEIHLISQIAGSDLIIDLILERDFLIKLGCLSQNPHQTNGTPLKYQLS